MTIDYDTFLKIWQLDALCVPENLRDRDIRNRIAELAPSTDANDVLSILRKRRLIDIGCDGLWRLTDDGVATLKIIDPEKFTHKETPRTKSQRDVAPWLNFRTMMAYYRDCVKSDERPNLVCFADGLNIDYCIPVLPWGWLDELSDKEKDPLSIPLPREVALFRNKLIRSVNSDEELYIGYPVEIFHTAKFTGIAPVAVIPVTLVEWSQSQVKIRPRYDEADINASWMEYGVKPEDRAGFLKHLAELHSGDGFDGAFDLKKALPIIRAYIGQRFADADFDPDKPELVLDFTKKSKEIFNTPILFSGQRVKYSVNLIRELGTLQQMPDDILDKTALAYVFRDPPLISEYSDAERQLPTLPFIPMNCEQTRAVDEALNTPCSKVTGPPGTGKSQVAVNLIANLSYHGKSVLFASMNHKALDAIRERCNSLLKGSGLVRFCGTNDGVSFAWWQLLLELDALICSANETANKKDPLLFEQIEDAVYKLRTIEGRADEKFAYAQEMGNAAVECSQLRRRLSYLTPDFETYISQQRDLSRDIRVLRKLPARPFFDKRNWRARVKVAIWRLMRGNRVLSDIEALRDVYPDISLSREDRFDFVDRLLDFIDSIEKYKEAQDRFDQCGIRCRSLKSFPSDVADIGNVFEFFSKSVIPALETRIAEKIASIRDEDREKLKLLIPMVRNFQNLPVYGIEREKWHARINSGFQLLQQYFPAWSVTLLSLPKASPCVPALYDHVIIDEATQCAIPAIIPALFRAKRVTVVGDPQQFKPVITLNDIRHNYLKFMKFGMRDPYYQRFDYMCGNAYDIVPCKAVLLKEHYRCHSEVAEFCNAVFYDGKLRIMTSADRLNFPRGQGFRPGVEWVDVQGNAEQNNSVLLEVDKVGEILQRLEAINYCGTVGVVTPFKDQVAALKDKLSRFESNTTWKLNIATANGFQGGECDVMIYSICYQENLNPRGKWYLLDDSNSHLINVAVSRARAALILVGNRELCRRSTSRALQKLAELPFQRPSGCHGSRFESVWEERLYDALKCAGVETVTQYPLAGRRLDLALPELRIDIEIDGVKYHTNAYGRRNSDDLWRDWQVESQGWFVQRFWAYELRDDMDGCVNKVLEAIDSNRAQH